MSLILQKIDKVILWTDPKIVLSWLQSSPSRWTTFVANRVSEIQELTTNFELRYVDWKENPADYLSRGLSPSEIISNRQWWEGPDFLLNQGLDLIKNVNKIPEERKVTHNNIFKELSFPWSSFQIF